MDIAELKSVFADWDHARLAASEVALRENFCPDFDAAQDDYRIIYEVAFEPASLEKARLEFWLSEEGDVAVGIETGARISRRLKLKNCGLHHFAAAHEPGSVRVEALTMLFKQVSSGNFSIGVFGLLGCAFAARVFLPTATNGEMEHGGYGWPTHGLRQNSNIEKGVWPFTNMLHYRPW